MLVGVRLVATLALAAVAVAPVAADPKPKPSAKYDQALRRGNQLFDQGKWAAARAEFQKAYAIDPRPAVLFNIGSTYRREHDRANARYYYQQYIDKDPKGDRAQLARETIAELDAEDKPAEPPSQSSTATKSPTTNSTSTEATPPSSTTTAPSTTTEATATTKIAPQPPIVDPYPQAVIDRPATMPAGTFSAGAGLAMYPHAELSMTGPASAVYDGFVAAQLGYAVNDHIELAVEGDIDTADSNRSVVFGQLAVGLIHGPRTTLGASATFGYDVGRAAAGLASFGAAVQVKLVDGLAIISGEDQLVLELSDPRTYELRLPIGLAYQITPIAYVAVSTRLATFEMRQPKLRLLIASEDYIAVDLVVVPRRRIDAVVRFRAYDDGRDGVFAIRWRL